MPSDTTVSGVCDIGKHSGMGRNRIVLLGSGSIGQDGVSVCRRSDVLLTWTVGQTSFIVKCACVLKCFVRMS